MKSRNSQNNPKSISAILVFCISIFFISACVNNEPSYSGVEIIEVTKWLDDYQSAYSVTFDTGRPDRYETINQWLIERDLFLDYEIVSDSYDRYPSAVEFLRNLTEYGFGYFGHGHKHDNHDAMGYEYSLESFTQNYNSMLSYDFQPVSYAYPHGAGRLPETRQALQESGFLSGRMFEPVFDDYGPYIIPGDETLPPDWFALPSLRMESIDFQGYEEAVNNPQEFKQHLNKSIELGSWIISTYHAIGRDGDDGEPVGWGFYKEDHFFEEMLYVKEKKESGEVWLATMDDVTLYIMQKNAAVYSIEKENEFAYSIYFDDELDNEFYRMPLTLKLGLDSDFIGNTIIVSDPENEIILSKEIESNEVLVNLHPSGVYYSVTIE